MSTVQEQGVDDVQDERYAVEHRMCKNGDAKDGMYADDAWMQGVGDIQNERYAVEPSLHIYSLNIY